MNYLDRELRKDLHEHVRETGSLHVARLLASARVLGIGRLPEETAVTAGLERLVAANAIPDCNVKLLLYGRERGAALEAETGCRL